MTDKDPIDEAVRELGRAKTRIAEDLAWAIARKFYLTESERRVEALADALEDFLR